MKSPGKKSCCGESSLRCRDLGSKIWGFGFEDFGIWDQKFGDLGCKIKESGRDLRLRIWDQKFGSLGLKIWEFQRDLGLKFWEFEITIWGIWDQKSGNLGGIWEQKFGNLG